MLYSIAFLNLGLSYYFSLYNANANANNLNIKTKDMMSKSTDGTSSSDSSSTSDNLTFTSASTSTSTSTMTNQLNNLFPQLPFIELNNDNVVLRGEITSSSVSKALLELARLEDSNDEIVIFISSPGGSVDAGNNFIQYMNYLRMKGKTLTCVSDFAASMAFSIFQECDNRYVTPSAILMQHQMAVGLKNQYENLKSYLTLLEAINEDYLYRESARIGLSYSEFKAKILSDWWLYGEQNVIDNVADKLVYVGCTQEMFETEDHIKVKYRGDYYNVVFSKCPLSRAPLRIDNAENLSNNTINELFQFIEESSNKV